MEKRSIPCRPCAPIFLRACAEGNPADWACLEQRDRTWVRACAEIKPAK